MSRKTRLRKIQAAGTEPAKSRAPEQLTATPPVFRSLGQRLLLALLLVILPLVLIHWWKAVIESSEVVCQETTRRATLTADLLPPMRPCIPAPFFVSGMAMWVDLAEAKLDYFFAPLAAFLGLFVLYPVIPLWIGAVRKRWKPLYEPAALAAACGGLGWFIFHFGNRQFGGFDFSILLETGWRLIQGEVPYRDFPCAMPPGFFLGVKYAMLVFGVRWDAILWATVLFTCITFLWIYVLLRQILEAPLTAFLIALCVESGPMLLLSFWWYNNVTSIAGAVFLLSCLLYLKRDDRRWVQVSYVASLAMLGLMKPNVAFLGCFYGVVLLVLAVKDRKRVLWLTTLAIAINLGILFANHVSVGGLISSYLAVIGERGKDPAFGFKHIAGEDIGRVLVLFAMLLLPWLVWWRRTREAWKVAHGGGARGPLAACILLLGAPITSMVAMLTNGEFKEVEWPLIICAGSVLLYALDVADPPAAIRSPMLARWYACVLCLLLAGNLCQGTMRYRVYTIGEHRFFEWHEAYPAEQHFFQDMFAARRFQKTLDEVGQVLRSSPGPVYFGPRMEFAYAAFRAPSPKVLPIWWDPGTAFSVKDQPHYEDLWVQQHFQTLIFIKHDATYFSPDFIQRVRDLYVEDPRWPELTVMHPRPPGDIQP